MKLQISTNRLNLSPRLKQNLIRKLNKLEKLLKTFSQDLKTANLRIIKTKNHQYQANFDMLLPGKEKIFAKNTGQKITGVVLGLRHQVAKQIQKYKGHLKLR